jgi:hypothetical protein
VRTRITDQGAQSLAGIPGLTHLNLDYTKTGDEGLAHLRRLPALEELRLDSANITDAGAAHLAAMKQLRLLNLYHTLVGEAAYQRLRRELPACRIIWDRDSSLPNRRGS